MAILFRTGMVLEKIYTKSYYMSNSNKPLPSEIGHSVVIEIYFVGGA
jgi:hypothetical protein